MRITLMLVWACCALAAPVLAQDPGMQAAQQASQLATQAAQQANQQAMQATQQANQASMQAAQQTASSCCALTRSPRLSVKGGTYAAPVTVKLKDSTRGATIYYTTDGWTPTAGSTRYTGPIQISSTTELQAIAFAPDCSPSLPVSAVYTLPAVPSSPAPGTALLTFSAPVTSKGLEIGDNLPVVLAEDLNFDGQFVIPKGTPALAKVIQVDGPGMGGAPGVLTFAVHSVTFHDRTIRLAGTETKQGKWHLNTARALFLIPGIGLSAALVRGEDATIPQGAKLLVRVEGESRAADEGPFGPRAAGP